MSTHPVAPMRVTQTSTPSVHIVDATNGPLIGEGRFRRMVPFVVTASACMVIAVPTTSWARPGFAVAGSLLAGVTIIASLLFPWNGLPREAQLAPPFLFLIATMMLVHASGFGIGSPFVTLSVLPLMWLAIYEGRAAVLVAATIAGVALWLAEPSGRVSITAEGKTSTLVFVICGTGMGVTLHGFVADARRLTVALRDRQLALEDTAAMLDALPERVNRYRVSDHAITYCNATWAAQYNAGSQEVLGRPLEQFLSDDELAGLHAQLARLGPDHPILIDTEARAVPNAPGQWLQWIDRYLTGPNGPEVLSIGRDVTERRHAEIKLAESEARFRDLADKSADVVWRFLIEPTPHFDYVSPSVERVLGYPPSYFVEGSGWERDILDDAGRAAINRALLGEQLLDSFDFHLRHADGSTVICETRTTEVTGGLQGVSRDVTELRQLQADTAALALRDPLTGLANRRLLDELLEAARARTARSGLPLAVAFVDVDGLKNVNDTFGHDAGDIVLRETARRLLSIVRGADTVARVGGDEFVIVFEPNDVNAENLLERTDEALAAPIDISPTTLVRCPASIGIADTRTVGYDSAALLAAADEAMYQVKRARRSTRATSVATRSL